MSAQITAPWTDQQVESLNEFQVSGVMHPFTCHRHPAERLLMARPEGWECPSCDYTQTWAYLYMANRSWEFLLVDKHSPYTPPGSR